MNYISNWLKMVLLSQLGKWNQRLFMIFIGMFFFSSWGQIFIHSFVVQNDFVVQPINVDALKVALRTKARSVRQNLNGLTFTNFQHVHPTLQFFFENLSWISTQSKRKSRIVFFFIIVWVWVPSCFFLQISGTIWTTIYVSSCSNYSPLCFLGLGDCWCYRLF